jgi:hypothetical protein
VTVDQAAPIAKKAKQFSVEAEKPKSSHSRSLELKHPNGRTFPPKFYVPATQFVHKLS